MRGTRPLSRSHPLRSFIVTRRRDLRISAAALASELGVGPETVRAWESPHAADPPRIPLGTVGRLAAVLDTPPELLLALAGALPADRIPPLVASGDVDGRAAAFLLQARSGLEAAADGAA